MFNPLIVLQDSTLASAPFSVCTCCSGCSSTCSRLSGTWPCSASSPSSPATPSSPPSPRRTSKPSPPRRLERRCCNQLNFAARLKLPCRNFIAIEKLRQAIVFEVSNLWVEILNPDIPARRGYTGPRGVLCSFCVSTPTHT